MLRQYFTVLSGGRLGAFFRDQDKQQFQVAFGYAYDPVDEP